MHKFMIENIFFYFWFKKILLSHANITRKKKCCRTQYKHKSMYICCMYHTSEKGIESFYLNKSFAAYKLE